MADVQVVRIAVAADVQAVKVRVAAEVQVVGVRLPGPQGPGGPAGPPGPPGQAAAFQHVQSSPASTWTIAHNIGRFPLVEVYSVGGQKVIAGVLNLSPDVCQVLFDEPAAGTAILI